MCKITKINGEFTISLVKILRKGLLSQNKLRYLQHNISYMFFTTMKRHLLAFACFLLLCLATSAQKKYAVYAVGFYNQENLFDTCHDEGKRDYDFLPEGSYRWNGLKYSHKLHNMARALSEMGTTMLPGVGCSVIGMAEVENAKVLTDLCAQPELKKRGYQYCHVEGPDKRGIDCALLYNPQMFQVKTVKLVPYIPTAKQDSGFTTRGFLTVSGTLAGEPVSFIVCHLPSRFNGSYYREVGAAQAKAVKDSLLRLDKNAKVFIMGDMNDDPTNKSMTEGLRCKAEIAQVGPNDMYNPWYNTLVKKGTGTLMYQGAWNLFDQIVMTPNLLYKENGGNYKTLKFRRHEIFRRDYLFQKEGKYKGNTLRTHAGGAWLDGYSDHLPTVVYLMKEIN